MSDLLRMEQRIQMVQDRAREIYNQVQSEKENGDISTEVELKHRFFHLLYDFYMKLGKPTFTPREAWGPPFSAEYNAMMKEAQDDFFTLFKEIESLKNGYQEAFEQQELNQKNLSKQIEVYEQKMNDYKEKLKQEYNQILFRESFDNSDKYEKDFVRTRPALISPEVGGLILAPSLSERLEGAVIKVKNGSNGLPGNTHQVRVLNGDIRFNGETDAHLNIAEIIDENADTWFEFEKYYIEPEVRTQIQNFGLDYEEKISWVFDHDETLHLSFEVTYDVAQEMNWLGLSPFLPSEKGANPAIIQKVIIHDGKGGTKEVTRSESFNSSKIWMFESFPCKKIEVSIIQRNAFEVKVGHLFFKELETQAAHFLDRGKEMDGKRVAGPMPSIENLGVRWDKKEQEIVWNSYKEGFTFNEEEKRKSALFSAPVTESFVQADFEYITAYRYVIGIRELTAYSYRFFQDSEYVSKPFYSPEPLWIVELEVDTYIPEEFGDGDWINYFVSINDGKTWEPIIPKNVNKETHGIPKMYWINTNTPKEMRLPNVGYLELSEDVHEIRVKVVVKRPDNLVGYTPVVKEIRVKASTVSEVRL